MKRYRIYLIAGVGLASTLSIVAMAQQAVQPLPEVPAIAEVAVEPAEPFEPSEPRAEVPAEVSVATSKPSDTTVPNKPTVASPAAEIKVYTLKYAKAADCIRILKTLLKNVKVTEDPRTNSVIVVSSNGDALAAQEILTVIDAPSARSSAEATEHPTAETIRAGMSPVIDPTRSILLEMDASPNQVEAANARNLIKRLADLNSKSQKLASQVRAGGTSAEGARKNLEDTLSAALQIKFELEHIQIRALEDRLNRVKSQYEKRSASTKQILERRLRELVDEDSTQWTTSQERGKPATNADPSLAAPGIDEAKPIVPSTDAAPRLEGGGLPPRDAADPFSKRTMATPISTYEEMATKLSAARRQQQDAEQELANANQANNATAATKAKGNLQAATDHLKYLTDEYAATIRDLELQFKAAGQLLKLSEETEATLKQLMQSGAVSQREAQAAEARMKQDRLSYDRLKVRFYLYNKLRDKFGLDSTANAAQLEEQEKPATANSVKPLPSLDPQPIAVVPAVPITDAKPPSVSTASPDLHDVQVLASQLQQIMTVGNRSSDRDALNKVIQLANRASPSLRSIQGQSDVRSAKELMVQSAKEFDTTTRAPVFLESLREGTTPAKLFVLNCLSPLWDYASTAEFPLLADQIFAIAATGDIKLKREALQILVMTLPMTKPDAPTFQTEERRLMVKLLTTAVPRERVIDCLKAALKSSDIVSAFEAAQLASQYQKDLAGSHVDEEALEVCCQIVKGQWSGKSPNSFQRNAALQIIQRFRSRSDAVVPLLVNLLHTYKTDLRQHVLANEFSRLKIIEALQAFGPDAKEALPFLEDELTLLTSSSTDPQPQVVSDAIKVLKKTIQSIKSATTQVTPAQF